MAEPANGENRYTAFLSYSHADAAAAARLHRRLESYRVPSRLVGSDSPHGPVPRRLWPIFRDREELPAASDLSETVRAALAQSGALIILCSPSAATSLWVAEEIETFRKLHPGRPILAAILTGDPPDCFPQALRAFGHDGTWHEPLATDLRPGKDGRHLGLLKLVAGVTGLGLDDLVQRDASRRVRRVMAVTVAAVISMLILAALAVVALQARAEAEQQREEAQRQRAEAEGLIEFMLTDLRDRLAGVGNLGVMQAVNERALRYYGGRRDLDQLSDESLSRRARILQAIADDYIRRGNLNLALEAFREARETTAELLLRAPNEPKRILEHAKSDLGFGRVYEIRRDWPLAQRYYAACAEAARHLITADPRNPDYMMRAASSVVDLGNVQLNGTRDYLSAQHSYETALLYLGRVAQARPQNLHVLLSQANAYGWLADSFFVRQLWAGSLDARLHQYQIMSSLHLSLPDNADVSFRLAAAQRGLAYSYLRNAQLGDRAHARSHFFEAYTTIDRLITVRDEHNAEWRRLKHLLSYDLLQLNLGVPAGVTVSQLHQDQNSQSDLH